MTCIFQPEIDVEYLFSLADNDGDGIIGTSDALEFFQYTRIEREILSQIWKFSVPENQPMSYEHFIDSLRYISIIQRGGKLEMLTKEQKQQPFQAPILYCPYLITDERLTSIQTLFTKILLSNDSCEKISKKMMTDIILKTNRLIDIDEIMKLSDKDEDNELDLCEFVLAMTCIHYHMTFNKLPQSFPSSFLLLIKNRCQKQLTPRIKQLQPSLHKQSQMNCFSSKSPSLLKQSHRRSIDGFETIRHSTLDIHPKTTINERVSNRIHQSPSQFLNQLSLGNSSSQSPTPRRRQNTSSNSTSCIPIGRRNSTSPNKDKLFNSPHVTKQATSPIHLRFSSRTLSTKSSPNIELSLSKSEILYKRTQSPFCTENEMTSYLRERKEMVKCIDNDMEFESFSFSDDIDNSLDEIPYYKVTSSYRLKKELDEIITCLSLRKAELLAELEYIEQ